MANATVPWKPESPFLNEFEWESPAGEGSMGETGHSVQSFESPFAGEHPFLREAIGEGESVSPELEFLAEMEQQLHDPEFEHAVERFSAEVVGLHEAERSAYSGSAAWESEAMEATADRFSPAFREFELALDRIAAEAGQRDVFEMELEVIDRLFKQHQPAGANYGEYEYLFESFWKKARNSAKAARGAGSKARKKGARGIKGRILAKLIGVLKRVFRMILKRVLQQAIGQLPPPLQRAAIRLRDRLLGRRRPMAREPEPEPDAMGNSDSASADDDPGGSAGADAEPSVPVDDATLVPDEGAGDAGGDVSAVTEDADAAIAASFYEMEGSFEAEFQPETLSSAGVHTAPTAPSLSQAREQLLEALARAKPGEDLAPHLDNFIPAILPALKMASKFGLRGPLSRTLGRIIARFIQNTVGQQTAAPLGQAIANQGLRLMGFEAATSPGEAALPVHLLVAQTVEGTVQRLAESAERLGLESRDFENASLLEALAAQSFERAAAANWPGRMLRPEVRESSHVDATWVLAPEAGRKYYKRGPAIRVKIDPATADQVEIFAGKTLGQFLFVQKGLDRRPIEAVMHMWEAIEGTWLSRISLYEKHVPGLGSAGQEAWEQIHPLTDRAAGFLLGSAGLGRKFAPKWLTSQNKVQIGLRYYYLEITGGARPVDSPATTIAPADARPSQINTVVDCQRSRIVVALFLAEPQAQRVAASLRSGQSGAVLFQAIAGVMDAAAQNAADGKGKHLKVIPRVQQLFKRRSRPMLRLVMEWFRKRLFKWLGRVVVKLLEREMNAFKAAFIQAADDAAWGVTVRIELNNPPAMEAICAALDGKVKLPPMGAVESPKAQWSVVAGFRDE